MNISEYKGVWVFCEQREGKLMDASIELLSEGRKLADQLETGLTGVLLGGAGIQAIAGEIGSYGADQVIVSEDARLEAYTTDAYAEVICRLAGKYKPEVFLIGATNIGRDLGPRCAARLHTGLCADCTHLDVDTEIYKEFLRQNSVLTEERIGGTNKASVLGEKKDITKELKMTRPAFGGNLMATIICPRFRPAMATVRPGVLKKAAPSQEAAAKVRIIPEASELDDAVLRTKVLEVVKEVKQQVNIAEAEAVVAVGRGIAADVETGLKLAGELAAALGGVVAGSRVAVDSGWLEAERQVGQTGKTVRPRIYVALGISGAIQHKIGMQDSECIIAVNKDAAAPIFEVTDYGIQGDLYKVVPLLIEAIRAEKA